MSQRGADANLWVFFSLHYRCAELLRRTCQTLLTDNILKNVVGRSVLNAENKFKRIKLFKDVLMKSLVPEINRRP